MNRIVVYKSQYGSSRQYALWISGALQCQAKEIGQIKPDELPAYDVIIYVGSLYAGKISGFGKIRKHLDSMQDTRLVLCVVGITNPADKEAYDKAFENNVPPEYRHKIKYFALRGDQLFSKMSLIHRTMMKVPRTMAEKIPENERTEENRLFIENYGRDIRYSSRESADCVIEYIEALTE